MSVPSRPHPFPADRLNGGTEAAVYSSSPASWATEGATG